MRVSVREILDIAGDIDGQIYMRDFRLIDQSDMIVSLVPELARWSSWTFDLVLNANSNMHGNTQKKSMSCGSLKKPPSPFITETATKIFASVDEALQNIFQNKGISRWRIYSVIKRQTKPTPRNSPCAGSVFPARRRSLRIQ